MGAAQILINSVDPTREGNGNNEIASGVSGLSRLRTSP
jgi:hypothetical protein